MELIRPAKRSIRAILTDTAMSFLAGNSFAEGFVLGRIDHMTVEQLERAKRVIIKCAKELES